MTGTTGFLVRKVRGERGGDPGKGGPNRRGRGTGTPRGHRLIERREVHKHRGMLHLHPLHVEETGRRTLIDRVPEPRVLALMVRVQRVRDQAQLRGDNLRMADITRRNPSST